MFGKAGIAVCALAMLAGCKGRETASNPSGATEEVTQTSAAITTASAPLAPEQAKAIAHERHEGMEKIGKATKAIKNQLDSTTPDLAAVRAAAATIDAGAQQSSRWFPAGSGSDSIKTRAKPEIWTKRADFDAKLGDFQRAATNFRSAAATGDMSQVQARFGDLGKTCKACHDPYRAPHH